MRTVSATQLAALQSRYRDIRFRVFIDSTGGGVYVNLSSLEGYDWVRSVNWNENLDENVSSATITLNRAVYNYNLAPYFGASKLNNGIRLLDAGRRVYIETATVVQGSPIADSNYVRVWQGFVDSVDPQAETIELTCRDESSVLIDRMI